MKITATIPKLKDLQEALVRLPERAVKEVDLAIKRSGEVIAQNVREETPVKTGALKSSIRVRHSPLKAVISTGQPYAIAVHEGTRPHVIRPRNKKALFWKGALHPVRQVNHPGTRANPFMQRGLDKSLGEIDRILQHHLNKINLN